MKKKISYLRFLQLSHAMRELPHYPDLDAVEERILNLCAGFWYSDIKMLVTDFAKMLPGISERTVHRRLKQLIAKDMLRLETDTVDRRIKYICSTRLCEKYFMKLNECMENSILIEQKWRSGRDSNPRPPA